MSFSVSKVEMNELKDLLTQLDYFKSVVHDEKKVTDIEKKLLKWKNDKTLSYYASNSNSNSNSDSQTRTTMNRYIPYPDYSDKNFHKNLLNKKEYKRYIDESALPQTCNPTNFALTKNQKFLKNFIHPSTPYNSILLFHDVGVGKTLTAISLAEQFITHLRKKIIVIMPGNLKDNFKKQIFDVSRLDQPVSKSYYNKVYDSTLTLDALEKKGAKLVRQKYEFFGFQEFANNVLNQIESIKKQEKVDSFLKDMYSNTVIIIDEVHNLRVGTNEDKKVPPVLLRVLNSAINTKLILMTATPMFNDATEITWLLNLMLANDKRPLLNDDDMFENNSSKISSNGLKILKEVATGYISRVRGGNPETFPLRLTPSLSGINILSKKPSKDSNGILIPKALRLSKLELIPSYMSQSQKKIYMFAQGQHTIDDTKEKETDDEKSGISTIVQISNIVFPYTVTQKSHYKEACGIRGFNNAFEQITKNGTTQLNYSKTALRIAGGEFLSDNLISNYAPKLKQIVDLILNSTGIIYVYSFFLYSGIIPLAIALEHAGFQRYGSTNIMETPVTLNKTSTRKHKQKQKQKQFKYTILSSKAEFTKDFEADIAAIRSEDNKNGDIVKVILGSSASAEGIDFKNIREVHFIEPWYHLNKMEQVIGRATRHCSHVSLQDEHRNVTIYHHVNKIDKDTVVESIDERIYRIAENKQENIDDIERVLQDVAIDCNLHVTSASAGSNDAETSQGKKIKMKPTVKKQTNCIYKNTNTTTDTSTFGLQFMEFDIEETIIRLQEIFSQHHVLTYNEIIQELAAYESRQLESIDVDVLNHALQRMIDNKLHITVKTNLDVAVPGYMIYRNNKYMFQPASISDIALRCEQRQNYQPESKTTIYFSSNNTQSNSKTPSNVNVESSSTFNEFVTNITSLQEQLPVYMHDSIVDYFVDRLRPTDIVPFCIWVLNKNHDNIRLSLIRSLESAYILHTNNNKTQKSPKKQNSPARTIQYKFIYNIITDDLYVVKHSTNNIIATVADTRDSNMFFNNAREKDAYVIDRKELLAYMEAVTKGGMFTVNFKLIDKSKPFSDGYVCLKTSTLTNDILKNNINSLDLNTSEEPTFNIDKSRKKPDLCMFYELLLRKAKPLSFARIYKARQLGVGKNRKKISE